MKEATLPWLKKAQGDYVSMNREFGAVRNPNYDSACFHAQQCVEKLIKGFLVEMGIYFGKTHDLRMLLRLTYPFRPEWKGIEEDAHGLSAHAVDSRYPGEDRTREEAQHAIKVCKKIRKAVLAALKESDQLPL